MNPGLVDVTGVVSGDNLVMRYRKNGIHTYRQCRACLQRRNREQLARARP